MAIARYREDTIQKYKVQLIFLRICAYITGFEHLA